MLDSRQRVHLTPSQKASSGPTKSKKTLLSAERRLLSDSSGPTEQPVRGPLYKSENETWMWSLNCLPCGPRTAFKLVIFDTFFASLILLENPIFFKWLCTNYSHIRCSNLRQKIGQNFRPSKTNLNCCRAVLWTPNCPSKFRHESMQR